jgi:hypothetical protein
MDNTEIRLMASELVSDYGKQGGVDTCFDSIKQTEDESEIVFWEKVLKYIEDNYDDDVSFMMGEL